MLTLCAVCLSLWFQVRFNSLFGFIDTNSMMLLLSANNMGQGTLGWYIISEPWCKLIAFRDLFLVHAINVLANQCSIMHMFGVINSLHWNFFIFQTFDFYLPRDSGHIILLRPIKTIYRSLLFSRSWTLITWVIN